MDSGRFFEDKILSNSMVTDQIFRHLTHSELLECSLISKKFTSPSRQFLRSRHECLLRLDANGEETALDTLKLLEDCNEIFYNGITWDIASIRRFCRSSPDLTDKQLSSAFKVYRKILGGLPEIKYLTLENLPDLLPVRKHCRIDVEEIEKLEMFGCARSSFWDSFFGQGEFSNLKVVDIQAQFYRRKNFDYGILKRVLSSSPVLQEWSSLIHPRHIKYFAQTNKLALIKTLLIQKRIPTDLVDTMEAGNVALRQLYFFMGRTAENVEIFRRITSSSTGSLQTVGLNYYFCKLLVTTPGIGPFNNVKELFFTMKYFGCGWFDRTEAEMKADVNAQQMFPNANIFVLLQRFDFNCKIPIPWH